MKYKMKQRTPFGSFPVAASVATFLLAACVLPASAEMGAAEITIDIALPSASTHTSPDGVLAVRIFTPAAPAQARYAAGAPVVIRVPGGTTSGSLDPQLIGAADMIRIVFLFPGGIDLSEGRSSDGTYDYRGIDCITALRDVALYAAGTLTDSSGSTIDDVVPVTVLHDNIGFFGSSNGGNICVVAADLHGTDLDGYLRYIVQWESPVSSQMAVVDLGPFPTLCPSAEHLNVASENPWYDPAGYTPLNVSVDYGAVAGDTTVFAPQVFLDGNGDGIYTTAPVDSYPGCRTPDLDGDGALGPAEDIPLSAFDDGVLSYYSRDATRAMPDSAIFASWPSTIADVPATDSWWNLREAVRHYAGAVSSIPGIKGMVLASVEDHVQIASDKPHIRQAFDGWFDAAGWVKINPGRSYVVAENPALASRTDLPDNTENTPPADWGDATSYAYPDSFDAPENAGAHTHLWDGTDDDGRAAAAGVYLLQVSADGRRATRKMMLVR